MLDAFSVLSFFCLYMGFLFLIALWVERRSAQGRGPVDSPVVYSLSLAVYCTGWTYYGSVGKAATSGLLFLPIYLGPTIAIVLWWTVLRKMVRIKTSHHITSIADFISARYDKSLAVAALATFIALVGTMPYIGLQFKAIFTTFGVITKSVGDQPSWIAGHLGSVVAGLTVLFTISLGVRRLDPTERHPGLIMAVAVECLVKLVAFLAVGVFVTYFMFDGFSDVFTRLSQELPSAVAESWTGAPHASSTWMTYLLLAMSAIMFLPRQFHVSVVENFDEQHIRTAMWLFPVYMLLINVFVFPMAVGGILKGYHPRLADTFVLALPLHEGQKWLSLLVFIGGTSAATGMIMISSITVSTMITNHFLLPLLGWIPWLGFLRRRLLHCRWAAVTAVILIGYWFERQVGESYMLVNIGLISFAAAFQFAPAILGGLFWRRGNKAGALLGLGAGFLVWCYTLLLPAFVRSGWMSYALLDQGPWGIAFLRPEHLFGVTAVGALTQGVGWSLVFNVGFFVMGSLLFEQSKSEQGLAQEFVDALTTGATFRSPGSGEPYIDLGKKKAVIQDLLSQYFVEEDALSMTRKCLNSTGIAHKERITIVELAELHGQLERLLAGSVGAATARRILGHSSMFSDRESRELSEVYADILAGLKVNPDELKRKIDYHMEREQLLAEHAGELERKVEERTRDLEVAQEELIKRERLSVLGQLTAVVSHELRNPLGVISFSAYYANRNIKDPDEKIKKHLDRIEEQVGHCDAIIDQLLEYTRKTESSLQPHEPNPWLNNVLDQMSIPTEVTLVRDLDASLGPVTFDAEKLRRVVINLIENAVQATQARQANARVRFYKPTVLVKTMAEGKGLRLQVRDNGPGMDAETSERAFDPLFTTRPRGTGLGLSVVRKIVEEHQGSVSLTTGLDQGTTVSVVLPEHPQQPAS